MRVSEAADALGLEEQKLREIFAAYDVPLTRNEGGTETVEITPLIRLAAELEKSRSQADKNWALLKSSLDGVEAANDRPGQGPDVTTSAAKWTDKLAALAAVAAAAAAIWAVCIASDELNRAIDAFKLGNQYQYQNDFISAFENLENEHPKAIIISLNERLRLGKQIEIRNGFPPDFWKDYTKSACNSLTASQCEPIPGLGADPTVYKDVFDGYESILEICYVTYKSNESICTRKED